MLKRILTPIIAAMIISTGVYASGPAPTRDQAVYEIRFLTEMIDHHSMAVMMADLCLDRTIHPQLHQLCESIKETQTEEIATMQTWLENWYGIHHDPQMTPGAQQRMQKLASLTGAEFEIEFMKEMIQHHWMAVVRARECQARAYHPELIAMCHNIETTQLHEIELMGSWLCQWYDICNYHGSGT
jgi:uncharacterized protein (DUF305 family)